MLGMLTHRCDCSHVMTRKYMVLKLHKHEQCVEKCVPVVEDCNAPACQAACGVPGVILPPAPGVPAYSPFTPATPAGTPVPPATMPRAPVYVPVPSYPASTPVPMGVSPPPMQTIRQTAPLPYGR
jgi:hypothetical protein